MLSFKRIHFRVDFFSNAKEYSQIFGLIFICEAIRSLMLFLLETLNSVSPHRNTTDFHIWQMNTLWLSLCHFPPLVLQTDTHKTKNSRPWMTKGKQRLISENRTGMELGYVFSKTVSSAYNHWGCFISLSIIFLRGLESSTRTCTNHMKFRTYASFL